MNYFYYGKIMKKLEKFECEVCGERNVKILDKHHIIPRTDPRCTNHNQNIAVLCKNCHGKTHTGSLDIIGIFPSTKPPNGRTLVYKLNGVKNIDIDPSYYSPPLPKEDKVPYDYE